MSLVTSGLNFKLFAYTQHVTMNEDKPRLVVIAPNHQIRRKVVSKLQGNLFLNHKCIHTALNYKITRQF